MEQNVMKTVHLAFFSSQRMALKEVRTIASIFKFVPTDNWPNQLLDLEGELKEKQDLTR